MILRCITTPFLSYTAVKPGNRYEGNPKGDGYDVTCDDGVVRFFGPHRFEPVPESELLTDRKFIMTKTMELIVGLTCDVKGINADLDLIGKPNILSITIRKGDANIYRRTIWLPLHVNYDPQACQKMIKDLERILKEVGDEQSDLV